MRNFSTSESLLPEAKHGHVLIYVMRYLKDNLSMYAMCKMLLA